MKISFLFVCLGSCVCMWLNACFILCTLSWHTPVCLLECVCVCLRGHAIDQAPQLFDHSLYQLLFVSVILPELREDVVLLTGVLHPRHRERQCQRDKSHVCILLMYDLWDCYFRLLLLRLLFIFSFSAL